MILNPNTVIGDCLETAFGLPTYLELINEAKKAQFTTADYRKKYNAYYRVRQRSTEWYDKYYELMENQRKNNLSFELILRQLLPFGALEVSFSSKLLSTIDTQKPIWDQYVLKSLSLYDEWMSYSQLTQEERLQKAVRIYERIENWYNLFLNSQVGKECISRFDKELPQYSKAISNTKKIDFMLVSKRKFDL